MTPGKWALWQVALETLAEIYYRDGRLDDKDEAPDRLVSVGRYVLAGNIRSGQSNEHRDVTDTGLLLSADQCASANVRLASAWPCSSALTQ